MAEDASLDTRKEADETPQKRVSRWLLELKLAKKRERDWIKLALEVWDRYRGKQRKKNTFNILWANTEVLRPALYNSSPKPDVRRRFRQSDMLGKAVSELMERSLSFCADAYDLDACVKLDVLDGLLPGRGLSRVRYVPKFRQAEKSAAPEAVEEDASEAFGGEREEVEYEQALCEHVQWDDFLHGPGKTWDEVQWCAFRHRLRRDDLVEQFGEDVGNKIVLNDVQDDDVTDKKTSQDVADVFKRAEVWEIWDKEGECVFFVNETYRESVFYALPDEGIEAKEGEPPLKLRNFFPIPRPLMLVEDSSTLVPSPLYELYRAQAEELDRLSYRINYVVRALKVRGVYDATLGEMSELMKGEDNTLIPAERAAAYMTNGGLEKAIWWMPIEQSAKVLAALYEARDKAKETIYELTGIADVIRGATDPDETLGAQKIKASNFRVQRMQREVQRYVRDLIRLLSEVIGQHFDQQTLAQMTGLQFPTNAQKQMIALQLKAAQASTQQPQQPGMPQAQPQPQVAPQQLQAMQNALQMPSWEDIMGIFRSDISREYRVDVETDSTVAESLSQDMSGLREVISGVVEVIQGFGPAVEAGAVSPEAVKAIVMAVARRARMGLEVEDALETGIGQPKPKPDPKAGEMQMKQMEIEANSRAKQAELAAEAQARKEELAFEAQKTQAQNQVEAQREEVKARLQAELEQFKATKAAELEQFKITTQQEFEWRKAQLDSQTKVAVAEIAAKSALDQAQLSAAQAEAENRKIEQQEKDKPKEKPAAPPVVNVHIGGKRKITTPKGETYTSEDA